MAEKYTIQTSFAGGYLDPVLQGTGLTTQYKISCKKLVNFLPDSRGYLFRRPGTRYGGLQFASSSCRMRTLRASDGLLVVIFVDKAVYLYSNRYSIYFSLESPYGAEDLNGLNMAEINHSLYILHKDYRPYVLEAIGTDSTTGDVQFQRKANYDALGVETAKELSEEEMIVFGQWQLKPVEFVGDVDFVSDAFHPTVQCFKQGRWFLSGSLAKPTTIYASRSPDYSVDAGNITEHDTKQFRFNDFTLKEESLTRVYQYLKKTTTYESAGSELITKVEYDDSASRTDVLPYDPTEAIPEDEQESSTVMYDADGEPTTLKTERVRTEVVTSATTYRVTTTVLDSHAIELIESDLFGSRINFFYPQTRLLVGTLKEVRIDSGDIITPATFDTFPTISGSTSGVQPVSWRNFTFYTTSDRRRVMAAYYDDTAGGYLAVDVSQTATSLFSSPIREMAVMEGILEVLWILLEDGSLLSCTLSGNSFGWAEHVLGGNAEIVSMSIYHDDDDTDALYLVTDHGHADENNIPILYLEVLEIEDLTHQENFHLLDAYVDLSLPESASAIDLTHNRYEFLEGDTLQYSVNHWASQPFEFDGMTVPITAPGEKKVTLGFPIAAEAILLPQDIQLGNGNVMMMHKAIFACAVRLYRSGGGKFCYLRDGQNEGEMEFQQLMKTGAEAKDTPPYFTGIVKLDTPSSVSEETCPCFFIDVPMPLTIQVFQSGYRIQEA